MPVTTPAPAPVSTDPKPQPKVTTTPIPVKPKDELTVGQSLQRKDFLLSYTGRFRLTFQEDQNLVITETDYEYEGPVWQTGTAGSGGWIVRMQGDGNFCMYTQNNQLIWDSITRGGGPSGNATSKIIMQEDGNLVIYSHGTSIWHSNTSRGPNPVPTQAAKGAKQLRAAEFLVPEQEIYSPNGKFWIKLQKERKLVLFNKDGPVWATGSLDVKEVKSLALRQNGDLVVLGENGKVCWSSGTAHRDNHAKVFKVLDDGHAVIESKGIYIWRSSHRKPSSGSDPSVLTSNEWIIGNEQPLVSPNGKQKLVMQYDGTLMLYQDGKSSWSPPGYRSNVAQNLMLRDDASLWAGKYDLIAGPFCRPGSGPVLLMDNNGWADIKVDGKVLWSTDSKRAVSSDGEPANVGFWFPYVIDFLFCRRLYS
jgi:hypothetical protein